MRAYARRFAHVCAAWLAAEGDDVSIVSLENDSFQDTEKMK